MELKISDWPPQFENIARELGIERARLLFKEFGGIPVYFPNFSFLFPITKQPPIII